MKLWLDDQIEDPSTPDRHPPQGWVGVSSAMEACRILARGEVTEIDFDHDLGSTSGTGYLVAQFIEKRAYFGTLRSITWRVHSANPVGLANIQRAMKMAEKFWAS